MEYLTNNCLERQASYFCLASLPLKPATIALKIGHLAFKVLGFLHFNRLLPCKLPWQSPPARLLRRLGFAHARSTSGAWSTSGRDCGWSSSLQISWSRVLKENKHGQNQWLIFYMSMWNYFVCGFWKMHVKCTAFVYMYIYKIICVYIYTVYIKKRKSIQ